MTNVKNEHKHAAVLRAIADGKVVEYFSLNKNGWIVPFGLNPITHPEIQWRIKPEPKPDVVRYGVASIQHGYAYVEHLGPHNSNKNNNLRLTFDGEFFTLKSAEVL